MIRNPDGTPYNVTGSMQVFDPNNQEKDLFNQYDEEIIQISGTPIFYYEVYIPGSKIDPLYHESRDKVWSQDPICLYAYYNPVTPQNYMSAMGIDSPDTSIMFEMNYAAVLRDLGHPPKVGARLFTPHKRENWLIVHRTTADWKLWQEVRLQVLCDRFPESLTTGEGKVTQSMPNFVIN